MTRCRTLAIAALVAVGAVPAWNVSAQTPVSTAATQAPPKTQARAKTPVSREPGRPHAFEASVSLVVLGPTSLGNRDATLTPNQTGAAPPYVLFSSSASMRTAAGFDARLGFAITRALVIEGGMTYSRPGVSLTVSNDVENAEGFTASGERLSQFTFDATLRVHIKPLAFHGGRGRPFVAAGAAYLRQLHEGAVAVDTGAVYNFGGGLIYLFHAGRVKLLPGLVMQGLGVRADARANVAENGFSLDGRRRVYASAGAGLFIGF